MKNDNTPYTQHDEKEQVFDLTTNDFPLPEVHIDEPPYRYYRANLQWTAILEGHIALLTSIAAWKQADTELYEGIQAVLFFLRGTECATMPPEIDCDAVELCIETSEYVASLLNMIENLEVQVQELTEQVNELENEAPIDGVELPPNPSMGTGADNLCRSAYYVTDWIYDQLLIAWDKAKTLTIDDFLDAILGVIWFNFENGVQFWQYAQTISSPTLAEDAEAYKENFAQALFCAELVQSSTIAYFNADSGVPALEKSLWVAIFDNFTQFQINEKALIGTLTDTEPDCTNGCGWEVVWDFRGDYVPVGSETVYDAGSWGVTTGELVEGLGYSSTDGSMNLVKTLPEQCKVSSLHMEVRKHEACLQWKDNVTWRGLGGGGAVQQTSDGTIISNEFQLQQWNIQNAILPSMTINTQNTLCGGSGENREAIAWVYMSGSGAKPSA